MPGRRRARGDAALVGGVDGRKWSIGFCQAGVGRGGGALWYTGFWRCGFVHAWGRDGVSAGVRVRGGNRRQDGGVDGRKWYIGFCQAGVGRGGGALWYTGFRRCGFVHAWGRDGVSAGVRVRGGHRRQDGGVDGRKWYIGFCQAGIRRSGDTLWCMKFCQKGGEERLRRQAARPGTRQSGAARTDAGVRVGGAGSSGLLAGGAGGLACVGDRLPPVGESGGDGAAAHSVLGGGDAAGREARRHQLGRVVMQAGDEGGGQEVLVGRLRPRRGCGAAE